jgi:integrase/recombinase XerD
VHLFKLHLVEGGASICNRNRIMTGVRFLFRITLRRHDLAAEIWHMKEPQKLPPVLSPEEVKRVLTMATSLKARAMLTLTYGCGLRASEVVRLRACDIDSEQMIIRVVQAKGRKDRNVMLPAEILDLLRRWWKSRPTRRDAGVALEQRWLFPGRIDRPGHCAPVRPAVQAGCESRGPAQGGLSSFAAPFLRNPSARGRQGHSVDPGVARTREA